MTAEVTKPGFGDFRKDASCEIRPQSLIGEYYVDCQPGKSEERLPERRHGPGRADLLDDPDGPRQQHHAAPLPRALPPDHHRARHRPRRPPGRPPGGAPARPPGPARDLARAADPRRPEPGHQELHRRLGHGRRRAREEQARRGALGQGGRPHGRDLGHPPRRAARAASSASRSSSTSCSPRWRASASWPTSRRRCWRTSQRAAPDLDTFFTRLGPFAEASRPAVRSLGEAGEVGTRAFTQGQAGDRRAAQPGGGRAGASPSRCASSSRRSTTASARSRPTRARRRPRRRRPTRRPSRVRAASPAWRRSGTTSSGRRSASTCWTTTAHMLRASLTAAARLHRVAQRAAEDARPTRPFQEVQLVPRPDQPGIYSRRPARRRRRGAPPTCARRAASPPSGSASSAARASPRPARCPASATSRSRRSCCRRDLQHLLDSLGPRQRRKLRDDLKTKPEELRRSSRRSLLRARRAPPPIDDQTTGQLLDFLLAP